MHSLTPGVHELTNWVVHKQRTFMLPTGGRWVVPRQAGVWQGPVVPCMLPGGQDTLDPRALSSTGL